MRPRLYKGRKLTKSEQMARVRSRDTGVETALRSALWEAGLRYRVRPNLPGTPDLAFPAARIAVFVDGCFWHGCRVHYTEPVRNVDFWRRKLARNMERDRRVDAELTRMSWRVVRVWEHEITGELGATISRLRKIILTGGNPHRAEEGRPAGTSSTGEPAAKRCNGERRQGRASDGVERHYDE